MGSREFFLFAFDVVISVAAVGMTPLFRSREDLKKQYSLGVKVQIARNAHLTGRHLFESQNLILLSRCGRLDAICLSFILVTWVKQWESTLKSNIKDNCYFHARSPTALQPAP